MKLASAALLIGCLSASICHASPDTSTADVAGDTFKGGVGRRLKAKEKKDKGDRKKRRSNEQHIVEHLMDATTQTLTQFMAVPEKRPSSEADVELGQNKIDLTDVISMISPAEMNVPCLTIEQCRQKQGSMKDEGLVSGYFYVDEWETKGCFRKNDNVFFGTNGTVAEMTETDLPGIRERLYCQPEGIVAETGEPSKKPTPLPTALPTDTPTQKPVTESPTTAQPTTASPSKGPSLSPITMSPSLAPTSLAPSPAPTSLEPSPAPTSLAPTKESTGSPSPNPTQGPTTGQPSKAPSVMESAKPSLMKSEAPSEQPTTKQPTQSPLIAESNTPSMYHSTAPSVAKSGQPSVLKSELPSAQPTTKDPTLSPSATPSTASPTSSPSSSPTVEPTKSPSSSPIATPTVAPTESWPVSLGGIIWNDEDEDGTMGVWEERVSGVVVEAKSCSNDRTVAFGFSRSDGTYRLNDIGPAGCYYLQFVPKPGYVLAVPSSGRTEDIILTNGEEDFSWNAAVVFTPPTPEPTESPVAMSDSASIVDRGQTVSPTTGQPSATPSRKPTPAPSASPSMIKSEQPSVSKSVKPSAAKSEQPSVTNSEQPSAAKSEQPSVTKSVEPSMTKSDQPSVAKSAEPSFQSSVQPSVDRSDEPSSSPSAKPTDAPSASPSSSWPTNSPSSSPPTQSPSQSPSMKPTEEPATPSPTDKPTNMPTPEPSGSPFVERGDGLIQNTAPTDQPSKQTSIAPTKGPSPSPTPEPSAKPTDDLDEDLGFLLDEGSMSFSMSMPDSSSSRPTASVSSEPTQKQSTSTPSNAPIGTTVQPTLPPVGRADELLLRPVTRRPTAKPSNLPTGSPSNEPTRSPSKAPSQKPSTGPTDGEDLSFLLDEEIMSLSMSMSMPGSDVDRPTTRPSTSKSSLGPSTSPVVSTAEAATPTVSQLPRMKFTLFETQGELSDGAIADLTSAVNAFYNAKLPAEMDESCLTVDQCRQKHASMKAAGIVDGSFYFDEWKTKGCFHKNDNVFFGTGGTVAEMTDANLSGIRERLYCQPGGNDFQSIDLTPATQNSVTQETEGGRQLRRLQEVSGTEIIYNGVIEFLGAAPSSSDSVEAITSVSQQDSDELVSAIVGTGNQELSNVYVVLVEEDVSQAPTASQAPSTSPTALSESFLRGPESIVSQENGDNSSGVNPVVIIAAIVGAATLSMLLFVFATRSRQSGRSEMVNATSASKAISNDLDESVDGSVVINADDVRSTSGQEHEVEAGKWNGNARNGGLQSVADMNCRGTMTIEKEDKSVIPTSWLTATGGSADQDDSPAYLPKPWLKALQGENSSIIMVDGADASSADDTSTENYSIANDRGGFPSRNEGAFPTTGDWSHIGTVEDDDLSESEASAPRIQPTFSEETGESKSSLNQFISDLVWLENRIAKEGSKEEAVEVNIKEDGTHDTPSQLGSGSAIEIKDSYSYECDEFSPRSMSDEESTIRSTTSSIAANSNAMSIVCRDCYIPAGNLDIEIASTKDGPIIKAINDQSLEGHLNVGDLIMALDDRDTRSLSAEQLATILSSRASFQRKLTLLHFGGAR